MKLLVAVIVLTLFGTPEIQAQNVNVDCNFMFTNGLYSCHLFEVSVPDNDNANIILGGSHLVGFGNGNVNAVFIITSEIPFIISQMFTTFPNLNTLVILTGGLSRIQPNAFANAQNLRFLQIEQTPTLRNLPANAFLGASGVTSLLIFQTQLDTIHSDAFNGLGALTFLDLTQNQLWSFPNDVFRPLVSLQNLLLQNNVLQTLNGNLLAANSELLVVNLANNQINAIERNFLDGMPQLFVFNANSNICVSQQWVTGGAVTIDTIRQGLSTCFDNFETVTTDPPVTTEEPGTTDIPDGEVKRYFLELRGTLRILDEDDNEVIQLVQ